MHNLNSPKVSKLLKVNTSVWFLSNLSLYVSEFFKASSPLSPFSPNITINTLASVPAPMTSPVFTFILYVVSSNGKEGIHQRYSYRWRSRIQSEKEQPVGKLAQELNKEGNSPFVLL